MQLLEESLKDAELSQDDREHLGQIGRGCQDVLNEFQVVLNKYQGLGRLMSSIFDKAGLALVNIPEMRQKLSSQVTLY